MKGGVWEGVGGGEGRLDSRGTEGRGGDGGGGRGEREGGYDGRDWEKEGVCGV